jgi:hypothetical protein
MISHHDHLLTVSQSKPSVAVAITPGHPATVTHERPPPAMGHQAQHAHQERVPTPRIDTQNVFLCRSLGAVVRTQSEVEDPRRVAAGAVRGEPDFGRDVDEPGATGRPTTM